MKTKQQIQIRPPEKKWVAQQTDRIVQIIKAEQSGSDLFGLSESGRVYRIDAYGKWTLILKSPFGIEAEGGISC